MLTPLLVKPRIFYILLHMGLCTRVSLLPLDLHSAPLQFESLGSRHVVGLEWHLGSFWGGASEDEGEEQQWARNAFRARAGVTPVKGR